MQIFSREPYFLRTDYLLIMLEFVLGVTGKSGEYFEVQRWEEIGAIEGDVPVIDRVGDESAREAGKDGDSIIRIDELKVGALVQCSSK